MSKEVDYKKQAAKAKKAKREALVGKSKKKEEMLREEEELKTSKSEYDKAEHIRRKLLNDMVSKDLTEDRFSRLYDNFYNSYMDDYDMALFMILVRLSYDFDKGNFVNLINRVLKSIKTNEAGALVKGKKGKEISNFYDTSATLELLKLVGESPKVIEKYNKKSFLDSSGQYKIVEKFGTIEEAQRKEKRLLENMYNDAVRLTNLWRKKVQEEVGDKKGKVYKEEQYDEKELEKEINDERKRYELLLELSDFIKEDLNPSEKESIENLFLDKVDEELKDRSDNNDLFKELLRISRFYNLGELRQDLDSILESYDDNHNSILSILDRVSKNKILRDRYSAVRKAIRDDKGDIIVKTLENKYGPLDDFIDRKKMEFLNMDRGIKYVEVIREEKEEQRPKRRVLDSDEEVREIGEDIEELEGEQRKAHEKYKDLEFHPLKQDKTVKIVKKSPKQKVLVNVFKHTLETQIKDLSKDQIERIRNAGLYYLKKHFDPDSSKQMEEEIYKNNIDKSIEDYLYRLGQIIILVDKDHLKDMAQLLNKRLENQYYDVYDILNLSYKELLQDIFQNPMNKDFTELYNIIKIELNKFFSKFVRTLEFIDFHSLDIQPFGVKPILENIHIIQSIEPCNIEYKNKKVFEKYLTLKREYDTIDVDNAKDKLEALKKLKEEEKNIRKYLKNIVYYKEDDQLYCFNSWELEENFDKQDYNNIYTGKRFSDQFIKDFEIVMESKKKREQKSPLKIIEEDVIEENKFFRDIFDDINSLEFQLKDKVSKEDACNYYKKYVFNKSNLETLLNKSQESMTELENYCGVIKSQEIEPPNIEIPNSPSLSPRSHLSIPSIVLGDSQIREEEKVNISIPLTGISKSQLQAQQTAGDSGSGGDSDRDSDSDSDSDSELFKHKKQKRSLDVSDERSDEKSDEELYSPILQSQSTESAISSKTSKTSKVSNIEEMSKADKKAKLMGLLKNLEKDF